MLVAAPVPVSSALPVLLVPVPSPDPLMVTLHLSS
jgi:hypothetical protein